MTRVRLFLAVIAITAPLLAQEPRFDISRMEELVREGAVARTRLDKAKAALADVEDDAILKRTLFGQLSVQNLHPEQADEMVAAARRRLERTESQIVAMRQLVEAGVAARNELAPLEQEANYRRLTLDLAEARARTFSELLDMLRAEEAAEARARQDRADADRLSRPVERFDGAAGFQMAMLPAIEKAYEKRFAKPLPISAAGMTELHRSMGFDHQNRVDVALVPDSAEGQWLRQLLEKLSIPYFAFRSFVPNQATGAHIHIGPPSLRIPPPAAGN